MNKSVVIVVFILLGAVGFVWFGVLENDNPLSITQQTPEEVAGEVMSFYLASPNLVIETTNLSSVKVFATPADRQKEDFELGSAELVEEFGKRQTWAFAIPSPQLIRKIYVIGEDVEGLTTERTVFPIAGISDIYEALWNTVPDIALTLKLGEERDVGEYTFHLEKILEDSRCPVSTQCIQSGRLVVEMLVTQNREEEQFVISSIEEDIKVDDYYVRILHAEPLPQEQPISDEEYIVTFSLISNPLHNNENTQ